MDEVCVLNWIREWCKRRDDLYVIADAGELTIKKTWLDRQPVGRSKLVVAL